MGSAQQSNWAGNYTYRAKSIEHPRTTQELQELVARSSRIRALGTRHSFTDLADTDGTLVSLDALDTRNSHRIEIDEHQQAVTVGAGVTYAELAPELQVKGWALANLASLPHISIAGAIATGTHGSGNRNQSLAAAVTAVEIVGADGELRRIAKGGNDFDGSVVALGALGIVTRVTLAIEPTFDLRHDVYTDLPWSTVLAEFESITGSAYNVSLFTDFGDHGVSQVWLKSRDLKDPGNLRGTNRATTTMHPLVEGDTRAVNEQMGVPGPWLDRLAHFRADFTPSSGVELQSEYLLPRSRAVEAIESLRTVAARIAPLLQISEIRTVAADSLWLSSAYAEDVVGIHFTWIRDVEAVNALLPALEEMLIPLGARPHWGKCFTATAGDLAPLYPRWNDFRSLRDRVDPDRKFDNDFLQRHLG